jgi:hypothetical protein
VDREREHGQGCTCHKRFEHAHDHYLDRASERSQDVLYVGYGRPAEQDHDRGMQWLLRSIIRDVKRHQGKVLEIRTELDLKREIGREIASLGHKMTPQEQLQIAENHNLKVVDGIVLIPDAQLVIERKTGVVELANVEFLSRHYNRGQIMAKQRAGFLLGRGGARESQIRARRVKDGPNIIGRILDPGR